MKKLFSTLMLVLVALTVQAQILQPVKWKIQLNDSGSAEKEIVFTATADKGWHLYDQDLPEGGPVSTSFTFETLKGAELIGKPTSSVKPTTVYDELFAMNLRWYPGTVSFTQKFKVTDPFFVRQKEYKDDSRRRNSGRKTGSRTRRCDSRAAGY